VLYSYLSHHFVFYPSKNINQDILQCILRYIELWNIDRLVAGIFVPAKNTPFETPVKHRVFNSWSLRLMTDS